MLRIVIIIVLALALVYESAFIVSQWEQGLVLQLGEPVRTVREPGLNFKYPLFQNVLRFDKRILGADVRPAEYITLDKKRVTVDTVSRWRIDDPLEFYRTVRDYEGALARLNDIIFGRLRQEIASHNFKDLIREERENIMKVVTEGTSEAAERYGIKVVDVRVKRIDLPKEVQQSVYARMRAERDRIAKRYRAEGEEIGREIRAAADKEREILLAEAYRKSETLRGEGDAKAAAVYAEAFGKDEEFYSFLKHMELYKRSFTEGAMILMSPDSQLMNYLYGSDRAASSESESSK